MVPTLSASRDVPERPDPGRSNARDSFDVRARAQARLLGSPRSPSRSALHSRHRGRQPRSAAALRAHWRTLLCTDRSAVGMGADFSVARARLYVPQGEQLCWQVQRATSWPASRHRARRRRRRARRTARPSRVRFCMCRGGMAVVARPVRAMATSHADTARSVPVVRAHARTIPCATPRAAVAVDDGVRASIGFASLAGDVAGAVGRAVCNFCNL